MDRVDLFSRLFPGGQQIADGPGGSFAGTAKLTGGGEVTVLGIGQGAPLGVEAAIFLAGTVLATIREQPGRAIVMLVDGASQRMTRRDELLGLNEFLAHLTKCLLLAAQKGHRTVSLLYGGAAAGAFISSGLSAQVLIALPPAAPSVMDLPSIARVTKLPLQQLQSLAATTPIFAPGIEPLYATGGVTARWEDDAELAGRLAALLAEPGSTEDRRDLTGRERGGRKLAHAIAERVVRAVAGE